MKIEINNCDCLCIFNNYEKNSVDCIYCDVLFNTGKSFKDFDDNIGNTEDCLRFYRPIIRGIHRILKNTGLLYFHCDYNLSHNIKILLDETFGEENFRNEIIWHYNSAPRKKKDFGKRHDTIFRYSKTKEYYFNSDSRYVRQEYSKTAPRGYAKEKYYNPKGKILDDVWEIPMIGQNDKKERVGYDTQKPKKLLYPIIDSSCPKNGTFADLFCGSGTSLVVAKELGIEKIIGCDKSSRACDITKKRLGIK